MSIRDGREATSWTHLLSFERLPSLHKGRILSSMCSHAGIGDVSLRPLGGVSVCVCEEGTPGWQGMQGR